MKSLVTLLCLALAACSLLTSCKTPITISSVHETMASKEIALLSSPQPTAPELEPALYAYFTTHGYSPKIVAADQTLGDGEYGLRYAASREAYGNANYARGYGSYTERTRLKSVDLWLYKGPALIGEAHYFLGDAEGLYAFNTYDHIPSLLDEMMPKMLAPQLGK